LRRLGLKTMNTGQQMPALPWRVAKWQARLVGGVTFNL
jgi:hypothetical protein